MVGESGSGKSMTRSPSWACCPTGAQSTGTHPLRRARPRSALPERELCALRGDRIGMVFQEPMTALNPLQDASATRSPRPLRLHRGAGRREARARRRRALLERVGLPDARFALDALSARALGRPAPARR